MGKYLLNVDQNAKTIKGQKKGYMTGVMYLAPYKLSGINVCAFASKGCAGACLNTAGRGIFSNVQKARVEKTKRYFADKPLFVADLEKDIQRLINKAKRNNLIPVVRLNGTSDLSWEATGIMAKFPKIKFYDYTKNPFRMRLFLQGKMPKNYHLTFSLSENNMVEAVEILTGGGNVAMVFDTPKSKAFPKTYKGFKVVDGDLSDLRFLDKKGVIVGLHAKGKARKDTKSGFVQDGNLKLVA